MCWPTDTNPHRHLQHLPTSSHCIPAIQGQYYYTTGKEVTCINTQWLPPYIADSHCDEVLWKACPKPHNIQTVQCLTHFSLHTAITTPLRMPCQQHFAWPWPIWRISTVMCGCSSLNSALPSILVISQHLAKKFFTLMTHDCCAKYTSIQFKFANSRTVHITWPTERKWPNFLSCVTTTSYHWMSATQRRSLLT